MKKIISIFIIITLTGAGILMIPDQKINTGKIVTTEEMADQQNTSVRYRNHVEFDQDALQLQKEVVQFEIVFHSDDVIDVTSHMYVSYVDETIVSGFFLLTDGEKPLMEPRSLWYVPERKYVITTPKIRLSFGKLWLVKMLNERNGKVRFGSACDDSGTFEVKSGDIWYLTLAVPTSLEKSGFLVTFQSLQDSMEINQLTRSRNVAFYSANYNQFDGKYYSFKLSILGGFSRCNVYKEITTKNGSIVDICVAAHRKGNLMIYLPNGEDEQSNKKGYMRYSFLGNLSGTWKFSVKGWSLYFMIQVVLLVVDINPHAKTY